MDLPEQSITYMDPALYKAAAQGNIDPFENHQTSLNQLLTPNKNTILHVYLENLSRKPEYVYYNFLIYTRTQREKPKDPESTDFVDRILEMCPPLLLQANIKGEIPLHFAARSGLANVAKVLIDRAKALPFDAESGLTEGKKMLRMTNANKDTALHVAAQNLRILVVEILTKEDPEFSYSANNYGETPLYLVTNMKFLTGRRTAINRILRNCELVDYSGPNGRTALHAAVMNDDLATVKKLLEKEKSLRKGTDENGWSPLHYAAYFSYKNSASIAKLSLKDDVSVAFIVDKYKKRTALHIAAIQGNTKVMEEIVSSCPTSCELVDYRGRNALHYAVAGMKRREVFGKAAKISRLSQLIYEKDNEGNTPLHLFAAFGTFCWHVLPADFKISKSKMCGVNKHGLSVDDILNGNFPEKKKEILESLADFGSGPRGRIVVNKERDSSEIEKARQAHLVTAVLIATVTFAAAFTMPGGYNNEQGPNQGTAILSRKAAFVAFVISDSMSMVLSLSAVFIYFFMSSYGPRAGRYFYWASAVTELSMAAMVIAFVTGTYAVLAPSSGLAISTTFIGLSFFIIMSIVITNRNRMR